MQQRDHTTHGCARAPGRWGWDPQTTSMFGTVLQESCTGTTREHYQQQMSYQVITSGWRKFVPESSNVVNNVTDKNIHKMLEHKFECYWIFSHGAMTEGSVTTIYKVFKT